MPMLASRAAAALRNWGFSGTTLISRLRDTYWKYVTLLLRGNNADVDYAVTASPDVLAFNRDSSANNFPLTLAGDTKPSVYNPYQNGYYSCFFDGTGDFLTSPGSGAFTFGAADFTVEYWVFHTAVAATYNQHVGAATTAAGFAFGNNGTALKMYMTTSTVGYTSTGTSFVLNRWHHVAYCRQAGTVTYFLDGAVNYSTAAATTITETNFGLGAAPSGTSYPMTGYLSNVRVVKGQALYRAQFTPSTVPLTAITGTSLLACQAPRLVDNSPGNNTLTKNGDVAVRQAHPFALGYSATVPTGYSVYFDGTGDFLTIPWNSALVFGSGDFTIECWIYNLRSSFTNNTILCGIWDSISTTPQSWVLYFNTSKQLILLVDVATTDTTIITSPTAILDGTWIHIAVTRSGNSWAMFLNGMVVGSATNSSTISDGNAPLYIGSYQNKLGTDLTWLGYISNFRIIKGQALYTSNFTPSITALTAVTGTSLLTCQDAVIKDNSTNAFALTRNGDTVASNFHPFGNAATVKLPASYYGVYFDGTGDYITLPAAGILNYGTGDFTFETWIYVVGSGASQTVIAARFWVTIGPTTLGLTSAGVAGVYALTGLTNIQYKWAHVAITRASGTLRSFINGAQVDSRANSTNFETTGGKIGIESGSLINPFTGVISNLRSIKGTALYTAAFTPSTTPLTAVTNTSLLTCQSATIIDNSSNVHALTISGDARPVYVNLVDSSTGLDTRYLGSAYFDGSGDYMQLSSNAALIIGQSSATVEFWIYPLAVDGFRRIITTSVGGFTSADFVIRYNSGTFLAGHATNNINVATLPIINQWSHVAWVGVGGATQTLFINGVSVGTTTTYNITAAIQYIGGYYTTGPAEFFYGYIADVRVVIGTALYTTKFIPPVQPLAAITNTQLLTLQTRGSLSNNFFIDAGSISNSVVTKNGNAGPSTFTPNGGGWSVYVNGSTDYLSVATNTALSFGTGDFTIEMWICPTAFAATFGVIYDTRPAGTPSSANYSILGVTSSGRLVYNTAGVADTILGSTLTLNTWYHVAVTRSGTSTRMFLNGGQTGSTYTDSQNYGIGANRPIIGSDGNSPLAAGYSFGGYISNLRVVKGQALYTTTFTTSTTPLVPITSTATVYTSLLTCNNSYFNDWSQGNFTISKVGSTAILRANPFGNYQVTPKGYGYLFAGAGSYLTSSTTIDMYAQPITIEAWLYPTTAGYAPIIEENTGGSNGEQLMYISGTQAIVFEQRNTHGYGSTLGLATTATAPINTWTHFAMCLTASGPRIYVNGVQSATDATVRYWNNAARSFNIGLNGYGGTGFPGYISNLRVSKGIRYAATFTPSTTPFVADNATSLLTCQSTLIEDTSYTRNTLTMTGTVKPLEFNPFGYNTVEVDNVPINVGTSVMLDGSGDFLSFPAPTSPAIYTLTTTTPFTVECWVYPTAAGGCIFSEEYTGAGNPINISFMLSSTATIASLQTNGQIPLLAYYNGSAWSGLGATTTIPLNAWSHIVGIFTGATCQIYINGVLNTSGGPTTWSNAVPTNYYVGRRWDTSAFPYVTGHIYDLQVTIGRAVYSGNFIPQRSTKLLTGPAAFALNPTTVGIYDSAGHRGFSTEGDAKLTVAQKKYGSTGIYFDGTGDYLSSNNNVGSQFGTGDFTVEFWWYLTVAFSGIEGPGIGQKASDATNGWVIYRNHGTNTDKITIRISSSNSDYSTTVVPSVGVWQHWAVVRSGTTLTWYCNGVACGTYTGVSGNATDTTGGMYVGYAQTWSYVTGASYIDDLRITKGYARYTGNFDPPAALVAAGPST